LWVTVMVSIWKKRESEQEEGYRGFSYGKLREQVDDFLGLLQVGCIVRLVGGHTEKTKVGQPMGDVIKRELLARQIGLDFFYPVQRFHQEFEGHVGIVDGQLLAEGHNEVVGILRDA